MTNPTDEPGETFAELLAKVREGDPQAIERLVKRYESRVRLTARVLLGPLLRPLLDSADVTQSVHRMLLMRLRKEKFSVESPEQLVGLLVTIVRHKVAQHWRKEQRQQRRDEPGQPTIGDLECSQPNPANTAAVNDSVAQLMEKLSDVDRRLIELRLAGCSTADVAKELGVDARILRARLHRLRKKLHDKGILDEWL